MAVFQNQREPEQLNSAKDSTSLNFIPHSQLVSDPLDDTAEKNPDETRGASQRQPLQMSSNFSPFLKLKGTAENKLKNKWNEKPYHDLHCWNWESSLWISTPQMNEEPFASHLQTVVLGWVRSFLHHGSASSRDKSIWLTRPRVTRFLESISQHVRIMEWLTYFWHLWSPCQVTGLQMNRNRLWCLVWFFLTDMPDSASVLGKTSACVTSPRESLERYKLKIHSEKKHK